MCALLYLVAAPAYGASHESVVQGPCTSGESWDFSPYFIEMTPPSAVHKFEAFLKKRTAPITALIQASTVQQESSTETVVAFGVYWEARALIELGLPDLAVEKFNMLVSHPPARDWLVFQLASMECVEVLGRALPTLKLSPEALVEVPDYFKAKIPPSFTDTLRMAAVDLFFAEMKGIPPEKVMFAPTALTLLKNGGVYGDFAFAMAAIKAEQPDLAIGPLRQLVHAKDLPETLAPMLDKFRILLARSYYARGKYAEAVEEFGQVGGNSNELVSALSGLSWAELKAGQSRSVVGAAMTLESPYMRKTFAVDPLIATAISLNELCLYPEALRVLGVFKHDYRRPYAWLKSFFAIPQKSRPRLYPLAIAFLQNRPAAVDERVASEWLHSPLFLAYQRRLNLELREQRIIAELLGLIPAIGKREQFAPAESDPDLDRLLSKWSRQAGVADQLPGAQKRTRHLLPALTARALSSLDPDAPPPKPRRKDALGNDLLLRRIVAGDINIGQMLLEYMPILQRIEIELLAKIEVELARLNRRMMRELLDARENSELIEAEIRNDASQDIIWTNAHPEYEGSSDESVPEDGRKPGAPAPDLYDWGETRITLNGSDELWQDEFLSIRPSVVDNCLEKKKYLRARRRKK